MKITKRTRRANWILENKENLIAARKSTSDHLECKGKCGNGATCRCQSIGGYGYWAQAFSEAGVECHRKSYWSGSNPTPSTSINRGMANYIQENAPSELK